MRYLASGILAAATMGFATPAQASFDDQFVCAAPAERSAIVIISSEDPSDARVQMRHSGAAEAHIMPMSRDASDNGGTFHYAGDGVEFVGAGEHGVLVHHGEALSCTFVGEEEEPAMADTPVPLEDQPVHFIMDGEGFLGRGLSSVETRLRLGASREDTLSVLSRFLGDAGEAMVNDECSAGPSIIYDLGDTTLYFVDDAWAGWAFRRVPANSDLIVPLTTPLGTVFGSTLDVTDTRLSRLDDSTLGEEYVDEYGVHYVVEGDDGRAQVTAIWSGAACVFR